MYKFALLFLIAIFLVFFAIDTNRSWWSLFLGINIATCVRDFIGVMGWDKNKKAVNQE